MSLSLNPIGNWLLEDIDDTSSDSPVVVGPSCSISKPKQLQIDLLSQSPLKEAKTLPLSNTSDDLQAFWILLKKTLFACKNNTKGDTILSIIATAHQTGTFLEDVVFCDVVIPSIENEQKKFEDTMKVTQWLIDDVEMKVLQDADKALVDV